MRTQCRRLDTFTYSRTRTPAQPICLIVLRDRAVPSIDMRCDKTRFWVTVLLGASALLTSGSGFADKTAGAAKAPEWQKGRKISAERREAYRLCAGTNVAFDANTNAEIQSKIPLPTAIDGLDSFAYAAQLTSGRVDITINPKQKPAAGVLIYGPRRTTVLARGGHLAIIAGPSGVAVGLYDGKEASIGVGATWKHINTGEMLTVSADAPQGVESKLPVTPGHVSVSRPVIAMDGGAEASRATWDPVPGAKRYLVRLVNTETKAHKLIETAEPRIALSGLEPGRYEFRVSAVEAMGLDGPSSDTAFVNVIGVELPPGAFASQGKVYLESLQQVTLTHVEGLEATYDNASVYFKAANRASLRGMRSTTLYLRVPGSSERVGLELLPRDLHTSVEITPALARWPRDKVVIHVQLPKMLAAAPSIQLVPSVTVNNQAVQLLWARTEESMDAVIPTPPNYPGPWVLRAEVKDQHGNVLGRNFLEIASTAGMNDEDIPREIRRGTVRVQAAQR